MKSFLTVIVCMALLGLGVVEASEYTLHAPIRILGDGDFTPANGVRGGSGTFEDPYLIESLEIDATGHEFGIYIENTTAHFIIRNVKVYGAGRWGIQLRRVRNGKIEGCEITRSAEQGIALYGSEGVTIINNSIIGNQRGIYLERSSKNEISANILRGNGRYGIYLMRSFDNEVLGNVSEGNGLYGIRLYFGSRNLIKGNLAAASLRGIVLDGASGNEIFSNRIEGNTHKGIRLWRSSSNVIAANWIEGNGELGLASGKQSSDNVIYHNNFIANGRNAEDEGSNLWDNGAEGNFWDDYTGQDADGDGIGDKSYMIPKGQNRDRYPLMEPWQAGE